MTLRVLTLSTLFPDASRPNFGVFVERQTLGLAAHPEVEVEVVAPIGLPPFPLSLGSRHRALRRQPQFETWKGLPVHRPRFPSIPGRARWTPAAMHRFIAGVVASLHDKARFDVIDAEFFWPDGPVAHRLSRALGIPFSIKARGSDIHHWGRQPGCAERIVAAGRAAGGMLAVSAALKADMAALGMPEDRIRVHHTGVDQERFRPVHRARAKAALGVAGPLLLGVGHLIERKGHGIAIDAVARVPGATLLIVGEGPQRAELEARIARAGVGDRVRLLGSRPHAELPALFGAADVMVLPAASEGLANVWCEALACGTPVVTTDVGGARELIDRPAAGRLVARDASAFADAVRDVLADPPSQEDARAAVARFTWDANRDALFAHLTAVAARR